MVSQYGSMKIAGVRSAAAIKRPHKRAIVLPLSKLDKQINGCRNFSWMVLYKYTLGIRKWIDIKFAYTEPVSYKSYVMTA